MKRTETQRIGYFDGQLLAVRDLQDDAERESWLRGAHVSVVHNTWGVALGFNVSRKPENVVEVGPGVAYDCRGREIISVHTLIVGRPTAPSQSKAAIWWFDLVIRYREQAELDSARDCLSAGFNPREERPVWRWRFAGDVPGEAEANLAQPDSLRLGEEIPLARFELTADGEISEPDFSVRRNAQGLVRPHIAGGQHNSELQELADGVYTTLMDTTQAGFSQTPYYFARIAMPNLLSTAANPNTVEMLRQLIGPLVTIRDPLPDSFHLDVRFAGSGTGPTGTAASGSFLLQALMHAMGVSALTAEVNWMGIEPIGGCLPPLELPSAILFMPVFMVGLSNVATGPLVFGGSDI